MINSKKVAIIGCGYVGTALAKFLSKNNFFVTATVKNRKNLDDLSPFCQKIYSISGTDIEMIRTIIADNNIIILSIAAKSLDEYEETYLKTAQTLLKLGKQKEKRLFYTSSTSVYGDHYGKWVEEDSAFLTNTKNANILIETEKTLLSLEEYGWKVTIFRLAEIYGDDCLRSLEKKIGNVEGKTLHSSGDNYTNMIHVEDIVGACYYCLGHNLSGIYNLADDEHPTRKQFYALLTKKYNTKPVFFRPNLAEKKRGNKRVSNQSIKKCGYIFKRPNRIL